MVYIRCESNYINKNKVKSQNVKLLTCDIGPVSINLTTNDDDATANNGMQKCLYYAPLFAKGANYTSISPSSTKGITTRVSI